MFGRIVCVIYMRGGMIPRGIMGSQFLHDNFFVRFYYLSVINGTPKWMIDLSTTVEINL